MLENIKYSLIITVVEEGTPNTSMITTINTFKTTVQAMTKGKIETDLFDQLKTMVLQRETSIRAFK